jgi:hypothetical protein
MNARSRFLSSVFAATMFLTTTACVVVGNGGSSGNVTFLWSFNGQTCATIPGVSQVTIQIAGETLDNGGVYGCSNAGTAGITLKNFFAGTYDYDIQGRDSNGTVLYQSSGSFVVNGNVTVNVNMAQAQGATGGVYVSWTFPPSFTSGNAPATCAQTSGPVASMKVSFDNGTPLDVNCIDGQTSPGALFSNLTAGTHTIDISARDATDYEFYGKASTVTVIAGATAAQQFSLDWSVGSLAVSWRFPGNLTCAALSVSYVYVNFKDHTGNLVYPASGLKVPCLNGGVQGTVIDYLYADAYTPTFTAAGAGTIQYVDASNTSPVVVTAGVFPVIDGTEPIVQMQ